MRGIRNKEKIMQGHMSAISAFVDQRALPSYDLFSSQREQVLIAHLPLVRVIAGRIHDRLPPHVALEDLYSAGVVGLMDALKKFSPDRRVQFRSYAQFRIRGAILDSLRSLDWSPRGLRREARAIEQAKETLTCQLGRSPTDIEISQHLHIGLAAYQQLLGELKGLQLDTLHSEHAEGAGEQQQISLPSRPEDNPLFRYLQSEMRERLASAIKELPERERLVMNLYYYEEMTMREVGDILGVAECRISQMHASALRHLRALLDVPPAIKKPPQAERCKKLFRRFGGRKV
jgi:RNA polymerase sigma factor for flagellar operon FliA